MRPVPTKWETSRKISYESYKQILNVQTLSFKMIYNMPGLLPYLGSKPHYFLENFLCFLLIFEMFNEPYLLQFPCDLSLILWEQVSYFVLSDTIIHIRPHNFQIDPIILQNFEVQWTTWKNLKQEPCGHIINNLHWPMRASNKDCDKMDTLEYLSMQSVPISPMTWLLEGQYDHSILGTSLVNLLINLTFYFFGGGIIYELFAVNLTLQINNSIRILET